MRDFVPTRDSDRFETIDPLPLEIVVGGAAGEGGAFLRIARGMYAAWKLGVLAIAPPLEMPPAIISRVTPAAIHRQIAIH
jgi:hypothetical protein